MIISTSFDLPTVGFTGVREVYEREPLPSNIRSCYKQAWKEVNLN